MTEEHRTCVLCARRGRKRELTEGHVCGPCRNGLRVDLGQILDLVALASTMPDPFASRSTGSGSRPHPGSRPPIEVARVDPELITIRLEPGDKTSGVPLLAMLESWERAVREDRGFAPYGLASGLRSSSSGTRATLAGVVTFLRSQVDWMCDEPTFGIEQLAAQVHRAITTLRTLDPTHERLDGWGIPCPADVNPEHGCPGSDRCACACHDGYGNPCTEAGGCGLGQPQQVEPCGRRLSIGRHDDGSLDLHGDIHCPDCGTTWTAQRLLLVALADERVTVWGYPEAITAALAIPAATLRKWHERGRITRLGNRYDAGQAFRLRHAQGVSGA